MYAILCASWTLDCGVLDKQVASDPKYSVKKGERAKELFSRGDAAASRGYAIGGCVSQVCLMDLSLGQKVGVKRRGERRG